MKEHPPPVTPSRRRWWVRWARRALAGVGIGLLVLGVGHRPLAHWALRHFGTRAAEKAGLTATWTSSGSVLRDLAVENVRITGGEHSVVRSLTVERAAVEYDLRRLRSGGAGTVVDTLVLKNLVADIDLTVQPEVRPDATKERSGAGASLPAVRVPSLSIENVSLRLRLPGGMVEVEDFSLKIDPANPGHIRVARVSAPGMRDVVNAAGTTKATTETVEIHDLSPWPEVTLDRLVVDLAKSEAGRLGIDVRARQEEAVVELAGTVGMGGETGPTAEATGRLRDVSSATLAFWNVPAGGMAWSSGDVTVQVNGPVLRPDVLEAAVSLRGGTVTREGLPRVTLDLQAGMKAGTAEIRDLRVRAGRGSANVRATGEMPQTWGAVAGVPGQVEGDFDLPALDEWLPLPAGVKGRARGRATATFAERALTGASASVEGEEVVVHGLPLGTLTTRLSTTDGGRLEGVAEARMNANNSVETAGWVDLVGDRAFEATWKAVCRDLATVPVEARSGIPWPLAGTVMSKGSMAGTVAAVRERDWARLTGSAQADLARLKIRDGTVDSLTLRAEAADGEVRVDQCDVRFDARNGLTASGTINLLGAAAPVSATVKASLPAVAQLSAWSTSFGGPAVRGGSVELNVQANGAEGPASMEGTGSVVVRELKVDGMPEVIGLEAAFNRAGRLLQVKGFKAVAGPWRAEGAASWDGERLELPGASVSLKSRQVATLAASFPMGGRGNSEGVGPIPDDGALRLQAGITGLDLDRLAADLGRRLPVRGTVNMTADVAGTLKSPTAAVVLEASRLQPSGAMPQRLEPAAVSLKANLSGGQLKVEGRAVQNPLAPITLDFRAPVDAAALMRTPASFQAIPLNGKVKMPESSLAFLPSWIPAIQSLRGTAAVEATFAGTAGRPSWQAQVRVRAPEVRLHGATLPSVKDVALVILADERRLTVQEASVMLAGGRLQVQGGADLSRLDDPVLDLKLRADEVLMVRDEAMSLRANAEVLCRGPVSRAVVSGSIDGVRGRVFKEVEFLPLSLPNQLPPPPPPTALARSGPPTLPAPFDAWTFDLAIRTRDPVRLMGNVVRGTVAADLKLAGTGKRPVLTGRATMDQMWIKLPFSRLNITEGTLVLTEDKPFDPQINVRGESITDGRVVEVSVQGRALDPKVRLTSSPPLPEGEIASLLATGVTTSDLSSRGEEAAGRAAYVLVQQTYRKIFRQTARARDDAEPPRLSFEFALFGSDPSRRSLSAVYELNPHWRVIGRVGEAGTFRGLLHYLIRFR